MSDPLRHALRVLEYDKIREVVASYAASALGRAVAMSMRPRRKIEQVRRHLTQTEEMRALLKHARLPLSGARDVLADLDHLAEQGRPAEPEQLYHVVDLLRVGQSLRALLERSSAIPELAAEAEQMEDHPELRESIPEQIDPRDGVKDEATPKLAEIRVSIRELRASLRSKANRILSRPRLRNAYQGGAVTIKHDRYLLPVKAEYRSWIRGPVRDRSHSGSTLYIEPEEITLEGDRLIDQVDRERDEVVRILWALTRQALDARPLLRRLQERIAWLDFTYAKACYADAFGLASPVIDEHNVLDLREARHPYLMWLARDTRHGHREVDRERVEGAVVPLSARLGEHYRVLVVTGPNTGGKTVVLKTIGLNVLLALSGVPVAAAPESRIPCYHKVFADIGDEQSIEQSLSTFSSHLTHIIQILRDADDRSLILIDELGAGTDPLEGAALGRALLDRFLGQGWHTIITTHLGNLKKYAFAREGVENAAMEFDEKKLTPTYRMLMGVPGSSNALAIAQRMGLDPEILETASEELKRVDEPSRAVIQGMERSRRRIDREQRRARETRQKIQKQAETYEEMLAQVEIDRRTLRDEAEAEMDQVMRGAKVRLEPILDKLKNVSNVHKPAVEELCAEVDALVRTTPLGEKREQFARSLKKEDMVYVPKFRDSGRVKKIDKGRRLLTVLVNGLSVQLSFDDISWLQ